MRVLMSLQHWSFRSLSLLAVLGADAAFAQAPPPPPQPLGPPPVPAANPLTPAKVNLGKTIFWDEQLSVTGTSACGSCHRPVWAGSDPRSAAAAPADNPGPDAVPGTADDVRGSPGVPRHASDGSYVPSSVFGFAPQVGGRKAQSALNAGYSPTLFWDGRAGATFRDPTTGAVLIAAGGALENQALGPPLDTAEMSHVDASVATLGNRLAAALPLALADDVPADLAAWIAGRDYQALFTEAFGDGDITPARIAFAVASYERTLNTTQTPFDAENGGTPSLTQQELAGRQVFVQIECAACHGGALTSDNQFHYIGVRPAAEDPGRFAQTGDPQDLGAFRTPSLRNVELRAPYFHTGRFATLEAVVDFYLRGGDFTAPNKDPRVRPRNITAQQRAALLAFLRRPLTDPRVGAELAPFDRPALYTESDRVPVVTGGGVAGANAATPVVVALEPPLLGSRNFTVGVTNGRAGATATLVVATSDPGIVAVPNGDFATLTTTLDADGYASVNVDLGTDPSRLGTTIHGRWYVADDAAPDGYAVSPQFEATIFGATAVLHRDGFE